MTRSSALQRLFISFSDGQIVSVDAGGASDIEGADYALCSVDELVKYASTR